MMLTSQTSWSSRVHASWGEGANSLLAAFVLGLRRLEQQGGVAVLDPMLVEHTLEALSIHDVCH